MCYRSQEADESELAEMFESTKLASNANHSVPIMGDFSYLGINWNMLSNWNMLRADSNGDKFLKMVMDCYLVQHVCISTRCNNILDLILTNEMPIKDRICVLSPVDNSDHNVLTFSIDCSISQEKEKRHLCYNHKTTNVCMNLLN